MRIRSRLPLLFVAILLPCAVLATFGIASVAEEASQTEDRYRRAAEGALEAALVALEATAAGLPGTVDGAARFVTDLQGGLIEPEAAGPADSREALDGAAVDLLLSVLTEVERLERGGDLERAGVRLGEFLATGPPPDLAAAALTALGAIERKRGRTGEAAAAWRRIVAEFPRARDARGLRRSFAARLALIESSGGEQREVLDLFFDVIHDDRDASSPALSAFRRVVRARLDGARKIADDPVPAPWAAWIAGAKSGESFWDVADRELARERQLRAAIDGGLREWAASGGRGVRTVMVPGTTRAAADESSDPVAVVLAFRSTANGSLIEGGIAPLDAVVAAALGRSEIKALESVGFRLGVPAQGGKGPVPPRSAGDHLGGVTLGVVGADFEAFRGRERTRLAVTAGLAALALLVATAAAVATTRAVRREQRAARDRENFVAAVTHELKAPLASVRLMAEIVAKGGVDEDKSREFADRTIGECDRLGRLVSSVLELARIEGGPPDVSRLRTVDAAALAREVVRTFEPVARKSGFAVTLRIANPGLEVAGDSDVLAGAILNLLDNAVKYADRPGEIELEVAAAGKGHAAFSVLDRGRGVPAAEAARIFEPFTRLGDEMTRDRPGVGLGLALVSRIAKAHGGTASCVPREGGGSRFTVVLPLAAAGET